MGAVFLGETFLGPHADLLQLTWLHVSDSHRGQGLGTRLFERCAAEAARRGARGLFVSSAPSARTVDFYVARGCRLTRVPSEMAVLEPDDIPLTCRVPHAEFASR